MIRDNENRLSLLKKFCSSLPREGGGFLPCANPAQRVDLSGKRAARDFADQITLMHHHDHKKAQRHSRDSENSYVLQALTASCVPIIEAEAEHAWHCWRYPIRLDPGMQGINPMAEKNRCA